ncbi:MAG: DUF72 domain-containing protein [Candidatus Thorarchaeota archaeon]
MSCRVQLRIALGDVVNLILRKGIHIGTSGWSYPDDWVGSFYSSGSSMFRQYLSYFDTAEINSTFYSLPRERLIGSLARTEQLGKFFSAKIPRAVTHEARLDVKKGGDVLQRFYDLVKPISSVLQVLLIQLPPWDISAMGDLEEFLSSLDQDFRYAIEFRHESWLCSRVFGLLERYGIAYVVVDEPRLPIDLRVTTDFSYVRWHGHGTRVWYDYLYSVDELKTWVSRLRTLQEQTGTVLGYFNNHFEGNAPLNALQMLHELGLATPHQEAKIARVLRKASLSQSTLDRF